MHLEKAHLAHQVACQLEIRLRLPRKPTMTSVEKPGKGRALRILSTRCKYPWREYLRRIDCKILSDPLCKQRWKCGTKRGSSAMIWIRSSRASA